MQFCLSLKSYWKTNMHILIGFWKINSSNSKVIQRNKTLTVFPFSKTIGDRLQARTYGSRPNVRSKTCRLWLRSPEWCFLFAVALLSACDNLKDTVDILLKFVSIIIERSFTGFRSFVLKIPTRALVLLVMSGYRELNFDRYTSSLMDGCRGRSPL